MAYNKKLASKNNKNQEKAIESHYGFVRYVSGKVDKEGIENVLQQPELKWLLKAYNRLLDFAEETQLKAIPQQFQGEGLAPEIYVSFERQSKRSIQDARESILGGERSN